MEDLNKASLDVWQEHLKEDKRKHVSDRILVLDSYQELTEKETKELATLLKFEKKLLLESENLADINKKSIKKINFYKKKLEKDERLSTIFVERLNESISSGVEFTEQEVIKIYIKLREEDIDIEGHQKLNEHYQTLLLEEELIDSEEEAKCNNPKCIFCSDITDSEYSSAFQDLQNNGYLNNGVKEEEKLLELMVMIHRLETELRIYKNIDCSVNDDSITQEPEDMK